METETKTPEKRNQLTIPQYNEIFQWLKEHWGDLERERWSTKEDIMEAICQETSVPAMTRHNLAKVTEGMEGIKIPRKTHRPPSIQKAAATLMDSPDLRALIEQVDNICEDRGVSRTPEFRAAVRRLRDTQTLFAMEPENIPRVPIPPSPSSGVPHTNGGTPKYSGLLNPKM